MEFFADIASGEKDMVLLAGAEALRNQRKAQQQGLQLDWNEEFTVPLEDRGVGNIYPDPQEIANGMLMPLHYYTLIEQARRSDLGMSREDYLHESTKLMASFSTIASNNPYAQWPGAMSAAQISDAEPLTHLYTKRMIAQDSVNQGAALLLTSVAKARSLGIPEDRWVFMHGAAQGKDVDVSVRPTPGKSVVAASVLDKAFDMAGCTPADIDLIDIYSCFPCAVSEVSDHLGLPADGSVPLTLTGGLPFFGGPGNNYSMHGLAEMTWQLRKAPGQFGLVHANGGFLTKHAAGIFSCTPGTTDWASTETRISPDVSASCERANHPETGVVISYCVNFYKGTPASVIALAETDAGKRFVCCTAPTDSDTAQRLLAADPTGERVAVVPGEHEHSWYLSFTSDSYAV
jgi:acetyl-CoA C-acetyltransferase